MRFYILWVLSVNNEFDLNSVLFSSFFFWLFLIVSSFFSSLSSSFSFLVCTSVGFAHFSLSILVLLLLCSTVPFFVLCFACSFFFSCVCSIPYAHRIVRVLSSHRVLLFLSVFVVIAYVKLKSTAHHPTAQNKTAYIRKSFMNRQLVVYWLSISEHADVAKYTHFISYIYIHLSLDSRYKYEPISLLTKWDLFAIFQHKYHHFLFRLLLLCFSSSSKPNIKYKVVRWFSLWVLTVIFFSLNLCFFSFFFLFLFKTRKVNESRTIWSN